MPTPNTKGKVAIVGSYIVALVMDVDRIPLEGETVIGRNYHTTHGGKGSNMAACAARLGEALGSRAGCRGIRSNMRVEKRAGLSLLTSRIAKVED